MEKYIESDLKNNPQFFKKPHSGKFVDLSTVIHVVCNVNRPDNAPVGAFVSSMEAVAAEVNMMPPLEDVAPVVHGWWEKITQARVDTTGFCSQCGKEAVWRTYNSPYILCPNCGARMDG